MISDSCTYTRSTDIVQEEVGGSIVLLHTQNWNYFEFDKIGQTIWSLLEEPRSLGSLVDALMTQFEVDEAECRQDTARFLSEMVTQGLLVAKDA